MGLQVSFQVLQASDQLLFCSQEFEQFRYFATGDQAGLANANGTKLHEHLVLARDQGR